MKKLKFFSLFILATSFLPGLLLGYNFINRTNHAIFIINKKGRKKVILRDKQLGMPNADTLNKDKIRFKIDDFDDLYILDNPGKINNIVFCEKEDEIIVIDQDSEIELARYNIY